MSLPPALLWLSVTLAVFAAADALSRRLGRYPLLHPVLTSTPALVAILLASGTPYAAYADATFSLTFLLVPATVGLAVPLWQARRVIRGVAGPLALALAAGSVTAIASAAGLAWALGAAPAVVRSLAPRATTTPVALALSGTVHGIPALTAVAVLLSGVWGAMIVQPLLTRFGLADPRALGLAAGTSAHGIGTARAFEISETAGVFASIGLALNATLTAVLLSVAVAVAR